MTKHSPVPECIPSLVRTLRSANPMRDCTTDAYIIRRMAMRLHRWHEKECGTGQGGVERDEATGKTFWYRAATGRRTPCLDLETPALAQLAKVMAEYPTLGYYIQTDPRGASVYILRPGDVPEGEPVDGYYSRGIAVYR